MDFGLSEEYMMLKEMVAKFVTNELQPLDKVLLERELRMWTDSIPLLPEEEHERLLQLSNELGLWGIEVGEEFGGQGLGMVAKTLVVEEMSKSLVGFSHHGFTLPPDAPNLYFLNDCCTESQREKYFSPYCKGEIDSAMAVTEPGAGSDVSGLKTTAKQENGKWIINGAKTFISKCDKSNLFFILIAVTDKEAPTKSRFTAFLVDKDTPGVKIGSEIPVIGAMPTWEVFLDDVELGEDAVLGEIGNAFIQNWIADSTIELEGVRMMLYYAAWKSDQGYKDLRTEGAAIKVAATEMLTRVADRAMQLYGGMGVSKELGIEYVARMVRIWRIVEGPSEIHRWSIARKLLKDNKPYNPFVISKS
jgi:alkylation response protein AidB-like acyl-CoA dehydrogenase